MSFKSFLGWLLLLGALAVPAFLFWNWWSRVQTSTRAEAAKGASNPAAFGGVTMMQGDAPPKHPSAPVRPSSATVVALSSAPAAAKAAPKEKPPAPVKSGLEYAPSTNRDPTLSPLDLKLLAKEAYDRQMSQRELERALRRPKHVEESIDTRLELQGIVATPSGIMALVNGEKVKEGDQILGAVVQRITTRVVTFKYGGRIIRKRVE